MDKWFDSDNAVMKALSKVFDVIYLSIVFLLFSMPVVTMGASLTALYYATVKVVRRERGYIFSEFWRSFKTNFVQATIAWILFLVMMALMFFNVQVMNQEGGEMGGYLVGVYIAIGILVLATACYLFPVLSRFELKNLKLIRFSFFLSMRHALTTLLLLAVIGASLVALYAGLYWPQTVILFCVVPALCTWPYSLLMERVLKKYTPQQEERLTEDGEPITEWFMED